ncbi:MAG TPA: hypothetical protein VLH94_03365 [Spirochaetia bacterium]|nr:hypothetical protein [Spirochaetia bacterium]
MDIKKVQEIVENSQLTDEAKDLIYKMLPEADKPEVREEIMKVIDYEVEMNEALADEAEEILNKIDDGEKMVAAVEGVANQQMDELSEKADEKFARLDEEREEVDKEIEGMTSGNIPVEALNEVPATEVAPVAEPAVPVIPQSSWNEQPAQAAEPVLQVTEPVQPVVQAPQWNQPLTTEQPAVSATTPAPFPGSQAGQ